MVKSAPADMVISVERMEKSKVEERRTSGFDGFVDENVEFLNLEAIWKGVVIAEDIHLVLGTVYPSSRLTDPEDKVSDTVLGC
jgi:hypothetical protein